MLDIAHVRGLRSVPLVSRRGAARCLPLRLGWLRLLLGWLRLGVLVRRASRRDGVLHGLQAQTRSTVR